MQENLEKDTYLIALSFLSKIECALFIFYKDLDIDSDSKRIRQKLDQFFINEKFKKIIYFLICILPNYVPHEITKEF